jgi:hypothetical protein
MKAQAVAAQANKPSAAVARSGILCIGSPFLRAILKETNRGSAKLSHQVQGGWSSSHIHDLAFESLFQTAKCL